MSVAAINPGVLGQIACALQARLQIVFPPERFQFDFMPPKLSSREWTALVRRPPFIGLGWNELAQKSTPSRIFTGASTWPVFIVVNNQAGTRNRYLGDAQGPGLFALVQAAIIALNGFRLVDKSGEPLGSCTVQRAANAFAENWDADGYAMAAVDVSVVTEVTVPGAVVGPEATFDLLKEIEASWVFSDAGAQAQFEDVTLTGAA